MTFFIFMIAFALLLTFILWLAFRPKKKTRPRKKNRTAKTPKKTPANSPLNTKPVVPSEGFKKKVATELFKRNPDIVAAVIKQWLREK